MRKDDVMQEKEPPRVPVPFSADERAEIQAAMKRHGIRAMSDFLRIAGLEKARKGGE